MFKKSMIFTLTLLSPSVFSAHAIELYQQPLSSIKQFPLRQTSKNNVQVKAVVAEQNVLQQVNQSQEGNQSIIRYQQMYKGIPVVGAQVIVTKGLTKGFNAQSNATVNGHLLEDIKLNVKPGISSSEAVNLAKKSYFNGATQEQPQQEKSELQIRADLSTEQSDELKLVYLVSFKSSKDQNKPVWPFFVIDAQTGAVLQQWNNIKNYADTGPGGNEKIHEYWYGKDGLPALEVEKKGDQCIMDDARVRLVNLNSNWDWDNKIITPFQYPCNNNQEENINGGFSPRNDAYYMGHTIVDMYKEWYGVHALQNANGSPMKLIMRVHFGVDFENAFWDGQAMSFGDGASMFYPLVSLDVAGHEVTHGFTQQHSDLEYHDQSGALNESMSDMAGEATRAFLLEKNPLLYKKMYFNTDEITWGIGETLMRDELGEKALRFMDNPSADGYSADCLNKALAKKNGASCLISYADLIAFADARISDPEDRQSFIVHTASGVFNKAFYLLSKKLGIREAYHAMLVANAKYWTPTTDFKRGACGVLQAAKDLKLDLNIVKDVFGQVGIDHSGCFI